MKSDEKARNFSFSLEKVTKVQDKPRFRDFFRESGLYCGIWGVLPLLCNWFW